jgi:hypothetical protein
MQNSTLDSYKKLAILTLTTIFQFKTEVPWAINKEQAAMANVKNL